jgi:AcrR family transcriptional regulator
VSAISYHFGGKEELYQACLKADLNILHIMETILTPPTSLEDFKAKLCLFLNQHFDSSYNNRELILILSKDVNSKNAIDSINKIFHKIPETIEGFFKSAQNLGIIRKELNVSMLCDQILSPVFMQVLFLERISKQKNVADPQYRRQFVEQQITSLMKGIL